MQGILEIGGVNMSKLLSKIELDIVKDKDTIKLVIKRDIPFVEGGLPKTDELTGLYAISLIAELETMISRIKTLRRKEICSAVLTIM